MRVLNFLFRHIYGRINPLKYAQKIGVTIGERCRIIGPQNWGSEPYLIEIGNHTEISLDCMFITHDGATWVFRETDEYKNIIRFGKSIIGNDCFIGARTTILPNVKIGDGCIIAAGALVNRDIPSGEIWGGVPAHFISTTTKFAEKCKRETPKYDPVSLERNKESELKRILK